MAEGKRKAAGFREEVAKTVPKQSGRCQLVVFNQELVIDDETLPAIETPSDIKESLLEFSRSRRHAILPALNTG